MKGNNTLIINAATLQEAIQEYLEKRHVYGCCPTVQSVKAKDDTPGCVLVEVSLAEPQLVEDKRDDR